jgi:8-oxo-dGTP pyrophosphatase MutT (NUDIX family)
MIEDWLHLGTKRLASTRVFNLDVHRRASAATGREGEFYVLDAPDWTNVVAITESGEIVLVEQYRHGTLHTTLEIPGGMVDPEDGDAETAARRELLEETGYGGGIWRLAGTVEPNPAILSNRCYTYVATGVRKIAEPTPDEHEELAVRLEPASDVPRLLREGRIDHALVVAAFMWWTLGDAEGLTAPAEPPR